jgi:hypothetical protein
VSLNFVHTSPRLRDLADRYLALSLQVEARREGRTQTAHKIDRRDAGTVRIPLHPRLLRREGWVVNPLKNYRHSRETGLQLRNKTPKRQVKARLTVDCSEATTVNETMPK